MAKTSLLSQTLKGLIPCPTDYYWSYSGQEVRIINFNSKFIIFETADGSRYNRSSFHVGAHFLERDDLPPMKKEPATQEQKEKPNSDRVDEHPKKKKTRLPTKGSKRIMLTEKFCLTLPALILDKLKKIEENRATFFRKALVAQMVAEGLLTTREVKKLATATGEDY